MGEPTATQLGGVPNRCWREQSAWRNRWKETLGIEADIQLLELYQMLGETAESSTQTALVSEVEVEEIQVRELAHGEVFGCIWYIKWGAS